MALAVEIVTPRAVAWSGEAQDVQAPGELGEFDVLPRHIQFLTTLRPGLVRVGIGTGERRVFVVGSGFAEAGPDRVTLLVESCEDAASVDKGAAAVDLADAESTLKTALPGSAEQLTALRKAALARARLSA